MPFYDSIEDSCASNWQDCCYLSSHLEACVCLTLSRYPGMELS